VVYVIFALLAVTIDHGFAQVLRFPNGALQPSISAVLVAFISLLIGRPGVLWAGLLMGLLLDLHTPLPLGPTGVVFVIGPWTLGMLAAAALVHQLRTLVFPRRAMSIGVMTFVAHATASLVVVTIYVIRTWYDGAAYPTQDGAVSEFFDQVLVALYSGVVGVAVGWLLLKTLPIWGFQTSMQRMVIRR